MFLTNLRDFSGGSDSKESTYNAEDPGSIPGSGKSPRGGHGNPLQYSCLENSMNCRGHGVAKSQTRLVAQRVKNLPAMWETWVQSLGWEDPLEEGMATHSSILAWKIPMDRGAWRATVHVVTKSWTRLSDEAHTHTHT